MNSFVQRINAAVVRYWASFSYVGLAIATLFFAASLTPSLLPRPFAVQGVPVRVYTGGWLRRRRVIRRRPGCPRNSQAARSVAAVRASGSRPSSSPRSRCCFLWRDVVWQNSIRQLMEMHAGRDRPILGASALIALVAGGRNHWSACARCCAALWLYVDRKVSAVIPRRISVVVEPRCSWCWG